MLIIGICGASGSGKSTLARILSEKLQGKAYVLTQDAYYRDHSYLPFEERAKVNYDEPEVFEHDELLADVMALREGRRITRKAYDYENHKRADIDAEFIEPPEVLIIEGIHCFYDERLREQMDLRVYVNVDPDVCLLRRIKRDIEKRGREIKNIAEQYLTTVKPMYEMYIKNYIEHADIVIPKGGKSPRICDMLTAYITKVLMENEK